MGVEVRKGCGAVRGTLDVPTPQSFLGTVAWTPLTEKFYWIEKNNN